MFGRIDEYAPSFMANQIERSSAGLNERSMPTDFVNLAPYAQSIGNRVLLQQA